MTRPTQLILQQFAAFHFNENTGQAGKLQSHFDSVPPLALRRQHNQIGSSELRKLILAVLGSMLVAACAIVPQAATRNLNETVMATELAFAKTMADRDIVAFSRFISNEAVFFSDVNVTRGQAAVVAAWAPLFKSKNAPFSWEPDQVEVLDSGNLALSTGPVMDAQGKLVGRFTSIWRKESSGDWSIIFDKGNDVCPVCSTTK